MFISQQARLKLAGSGRLVALFVCALFLTAAKVVLWERGNELHGLWLLVATSKITISFSSFVDVLQGGAACVCAISAVQQGLLCMMSSLATEADCAKSRACAVERRQVLRTMCGWSTALAIILFLDSFGMMYRWERADGSGTFQEHLTSTFAACS